MDISSDPVPVSGLRDGVGKVREVGPRGFVSEIRKSPEISGGFHHFLRRSPLYCLRLLAPCLSL
jgi:hypothetical protein